MASNRVRGITNWICFKFWQMLGTREAWSWLCQHAMTNTQRTWATCTFWGQQLSQLGTQYFSHANEADTLGKLHFHFVCVFLYLLLYRGGLENAFAPQILQPLRRRFPVVGHGEGSVKVQIILRPHTEQKHFSHLS